MWLDSVTEHRLQSTWKACWVMQQSSWKQCGERQGTGWVPWRSSNSGSGGDNGCLQADVKGKCCDEQLRGCSRGCRHTICWCM
jgi:hypothetical protein